MRVRDPARPARTLVDEPLPDAPSRRWRGPALLCALVLSGVALLDRPGQQPDDAPGPVRSPDPPATARAGLVSVDLEDSLEARLLLRVRPVRPGVQLTQVTGIRIDVQVALPRTLDGPAVLPVVARVAGCDEGALAQRRLTLQVDGQPVSVEPGPGVTQALDDLFRRVCRRSR